MKRCFKCQTEKPIEAFAAKATSKDGLQAQCRECQRQYRRDHYVANRQKYIAKARTWNRDNLQINYEQLRAYFVEHPCVDCGEQDLEVLEFDHRDEESKSFNVCSRLYGTPWSKLQAEIEKCDVRCANCHRRRTNRQFGYWRMLPS